MTAKLVPTTPRKLPDTIEDATAIPSKEIPWKKLGLRTDEYERVVEILDRCSTNAGFAMYSVMWLERCSYKSSKKHLVEQFGKRTGEEMKRHLLVGMGQSTGVIDVGGGWVVTFKVESHNHPPFVEPYQGAAAGVSGIVRNIISTGTCPVAVMDQFRSGSIDHPDTVRVIHGVVSGVGGCGNCLGLPNIDGETELGSSYRGNPFINALYVGTLRHKDVHLVDAVGGGNLAVLFSTHTGGNNIGGASILVSETLEGGMPAKRPSMQVGGLFMEKVLTECCLGLLKAGVVRDIQDPGVADTSCTTSELASNGDSGMHVDLERILLHDPGLTAGEILMSESQERMVTIVTPEDEECFFETIDKWDVETSIVGELIGNGRLTIDHFGHRIVDVDPKTAAHKGPVYDRPYARPLWQDELQVDISAALARPSSSKEPITDIMSVLMDVNQASKV